MDLIVKGKVVHEGDSFKRDAGVLTKIPFQMEVTPAIIEVNQVIYGSDPGQTIPYLQHGSSSDQEVSERFVRLNEEIILILTRTTDGQYWSYNFDDGVWKIQNGNVHSKSPQVLLEKYKGAELTLFIDAIKTAAVNKKKPEH